MKNEPIEMYSPHFSKQEMQRSATAIRLGLDNTPDAEAEANLQALCTHVLEPLRERFGRIIVTSAYRSKAVNEALFGEPGKATLI